jgi:hypothetical protein
MPQLLIYRNFLQCNSAENRFGQAYCIDLLKRILTKFNLYFSKLYCIFYTFYKFI